MKITVNGETREVDGGTTLHGLFEQMDINCEALVVQHNDDIVARDAFAATPLADGDILELVRFVGGG